MGDACLGSAFPSPLGTGNTPYQLPRAYQEFVRDLFPSVCQNLLVRRRGWVSIVVEGNLAIKCI